MYAVDAVAKGIETTIKPQHSPSCFECQNCEIVNIGTPEEFWCCETYGWGWPCKCDPPHDEPCKFFDRFTRFDNDKFHKLIEDIQSNMDD